ncbi:MAG: uroporphyrinogen-III synthase [Candidatus Dormibacteria bacterium]
MTEPRPRVVVTRGADKETDLVAQLVAAGFDVTAVPLIAAQPLVGAEEVASAVRAVSGGWVVVSSAFAAQMVVDTLDRPVSVRFAAVGAATAAVLEGAGLGEILRGDAAEVADADALAAALGDGVAGLPVLVMAAEGGRRVLAPALRRVGAEVTELLAYRSVVPASAPAALAAALDPLPDALVFASGSAARHAAAIVDPARTPARLVLCIGPHTAAAARQAGWRGVEVAALQSDEGLVAALTSRLLGG